MILQLSFSSTVSVGCLSMQKFINEDSKSPYIGFGTIDVMDKAFRGHIDG